jgi:tetratricopeptide (TPR) repeat protein
MWGLGCIFFELATQNKTFRDDFDVLDYDQDPTRKLSFSSPSRFPHNHVLELVWELLDRNPENRPNAADVGCILAAYCRLLESSAVNAVLESPSSPPYVVWKELIGKYSAQFERMYYLGEWYKKIGQQGVAVAVWRELLQSNERDDDNNMILLLSLGEVLTDEKRYDDAVELYQAAIAQKPSNVSPREALAELHRQKGSYREAAEIYENAIRREPMRFGLWFRLCKLYLDTGNLASAIRVCTHEIKKKPSNPSPVMILSNVYAAKGHYSSAIREYMNFTDRNEYSVIEDNLKTALAEVNDPWVASTFISVRDVLRRWTNPLD